MIRWALLLVGAAALTGYVFWMYLRVDLAVAGARRLAVLRALALVVLLTLLFDVRLPTNGLGGPSADWVLLDASLSMGAGEDPDGSAWTAAVARARALESDGWTVVTFGGDRAGGAGFEDALPAETGSTLTPGLERAAEAGARRVTVLSDLRLQDAVAVRSALEALPLSVTFERFGGEVANAGISRLDVSDFPLPDEGGTAEIELHGGVPGDSLIVEVRAEDVLVATTRVQAPLPGLSTRTTVDLPPPDTDGRARYTATVSLPGDGFTADDTAVDFAAVGREEGALVLVSLAPDWEPRYLLPVLQRVTGLPTVGYLRVGPDRFVHAGVAIDRGGPLDSATVAQAVADAALVVVHGLRGEPDEWAASLLAVEGRKLILAGDEPGADAAGMNVQPPQGGEWYPSSDIPSSPIAGALAGVDLQGLPPLSDVMVPATPGDGQVPLHVQLRGAGTPEGALYLLERPTGRTAIVLASGFWRWAARETGEEAYRRLWSGVAGWLLADQAVLAAEARPAAWVFARGEPVVWTVPADTAGARVVVQRGDEIVVDTTVAGGGASQTGVLDPGSYSYSVKTAAGDTIGSGRFDVAAATEEMLPVAALPPEPTQQAAVFGSDGGAGRPLRTLPWPYLLVMTLLCLEWIGRRRSGLR